MNQIEKVTPNFFVIKRRCPDCFKVCFIKDSGNLSRSGELVVTTACSNCKKIIDKMRVKALCLN
ncbi:MAG: hypothetical protein ABEI53_03855 [Candidatus Magasanikbacteria bacterium]